MSQNKTPVPRQTTAKPTPSVAHQMLSQLTRNTLTLLEDTAALLRSDAGQMACVQTRANEAHRLLMDAAKTFAVGAAESEMSETPQMKAATEQANEAAVWNRGFDARLAVELGGGDMLS
jgi:hypothetical protein